MEIVQKIRRFFRRALSVGRIKTPTVLQMEAVECGAASLAIILSYYKKFLPLEKLRQDCGVSRDGSKASNVLAAGRKYGLECKGLKRRVETLKELDLPAILFWNFNHFLVLEGFDDENDCVYLNDPAEGPRVVDMKEFIGSYTGIVLTLQPGESFEEGGDPPSIINSLRSRIAGSERAVIFVSLVSLALVIPGIVIPVFSKVFVDDYLVGRSHDFLVPLLVAMGITAILRGTLVWLQKRYLLRLETKLALSSSSRFFWHVLRLPIVYFSQRYAGEIGNRVTLNDKVAQLLSRDLATAVFNMISILFFVMLMFTYDVMLTLIGIFFAGLNVLALMYVARKRADGNIKLQQEEGKQIGIAMGGLQIIETLKASGSESDFFSQWAGYQTKAVNARQRLGVLSASLAEVPPLLAALNTAAILGFGSLRVMEGDISMGTLVAFQSLMDSFTKPINELVTLGSTIQDAQSDMGRLDDVFNYETDPQVDSEVSETEGNEHGSRLTGLIEIEKLSFGYSPLESPLIEDFSLQLKPGSRVALVGGSGSGKSTISKIVSGLFKEWDGKILFDGKERQEIPRHILNDSIAMVDQDITIFEGTVRDNLSMWDPTVSDKRMLDAAKDACIHDIIAARPAGYDSVTEDGGSNFSGGQRQRLELARALVNNPTILILDEATSALDSTTEQIIDDNLRRRGCTCMIVAHRLSTIRDCDEIIVLEQGKVVQRGTHDHLKEVEGLYRTLIQAEH
jgi:NHLM bacteriocin system ABC transporter peptidase/ATP-binding protein